ncbi:MAG: FAD-dependent oxidoreductase [Flavisolibacter sp.]
MKLFFFLLLFFSFGFIAFTQEVKQVDICVYGGTSAGVMAAYSAKKMGKTVVLIEPGKHLGGLTSGGLGYTDIGNKYAIGGLSLDFYRRIGKHYGNFEQWIFEPSVAEKTFLSYIHSANVPVIYQYHLKEVKKQNAWISEIKVQSSEKNTKAKDQIIRAKIFIDCSYEGDLMAKAGVTYIVGRESNDLYGETYNGVQLMEGHQFPDGIDPYKIPGDPSSGLLWGISGASLASEGSGDQKLQAYNFRICLTNVPSNRIPITRPENYDSEKYELLLRYIQKIDAKDLKPFLKVDLMPNGKTDINNKGPFSTDMIGMNYNYAEADCETRKQIIQAHDNYTKGLLYFIGHDSRMPLQLRQQMLQWGYPKDEYTDNDHWTPQLYVREARRMIGAYVMTQANCQGKEVVDDGIAMAAYTMDSHNCQRIVIKKGDSMMVKNEGNVEIGGLGPYPVSYRSVIPKESECKNLLVPVCLSASHIAYGSIRMEPVFMVLAQSSAIAASLAIDKKIALQQLDAKAIQKTLKDNPLLDGSEPDMIVDDADANSVIVIGTWKKLKRRSYGPSMLVTDVQTKNASVRFMPSIKSSGSYSVYTYLPRVENMAEEIPVFIYDGKASHIKKIRSKEINVKGQTSGEWIFLGEYNFQNNGEAYIEVSNKNANGVVVADAVLLRKMNK